jgi:hypothetical protein
MEMRGDTLEVGLPFFGGLYIDHIARDGVGQENDSAIGSLPDRFSLRTRIDYLYIFENLPSLLFSHAAKIGKESPSSSAGQHPTFFPIFVFLQG